MYVEHIADALFMHVNLLLFAVVPRRFEFLGSSSMILPFFCQNDGGVVSVHLHPGPDFFPSFQQKIFFWKCT